MNRDFEDEENYLFKEVVMTSITFSKKRKSISSNMNWIQWKLLWYLVYNMIELKEKLKIQGNGGHQNQAYSVAFPPSEAGSVFM